MEIAPIRGQVALCVAFTILALLCMRSINANLLNIDWIIESWAIEACIAMCSRESEREREANTC